MTAPLDEPVRVVDYDPEWPRAFAREYGRIAAALGATALGIQHVGSTAVPGLAAKPIVDVLVGVRRPAADEDVARALRGLGYEALGEAGVSGRLHFRRRAPDAFNVHVVDHGGDLWQDNLRLRDFLRHDAGAAREYADAKRRAAASAPESLLRYSALKAGVVAALLDRARRGGRSPEPPGPGLNA